MTTAGTRRRLTDGTFDQPAGPIGSVAVQAMQFNTGVVVVGGANVVAAAGTRRGVYLAAGASFVCDVDDLADVWVDATVSGEGVTFTWQA